MAIIFSFEPTASRPLAKPQAKLIEVDVWPIVKKSCSLSFGSVYPVTVLNFSGFIYASFLPVNILWTYDWCETSYTNLSTGELNT